MLRFTEFGLFLVPFVLYLVWRTMGPRTPPWATWLALVAVVTLAGGAFWYGLTERVPAGEAYVPAQLENGQIIPGHGALPARP
jgi:drug/metabolite transporter (DMT)-like permease